MKKEILFLSILLFSNWCCAQNDSIEEAEHDKFKFSSGVGLVISKQNSAFPIYSAEVFKSFNYNIAVGAGIDIYGKTNNRNENMPSLNFYALYNPYLFINNKSQFFEFFIGPGLEVHIFSVNALALIRADFNINKNFSVGTSFKQPFFSNNYESDLTYHIFKINFSYNLF